MKKSHETSTFKITFTRYCKNHYDRRRKVTHCQAADFEDAYEFAQITIRAFSDVDPDREYEIEAIQNTGFVANSEASIGWMTLNEWQAKNGDQ